MTEVLVALTLLTGLGLLVAASLTVDESALTGESVPVDKRADVLVAADGIGALGADSRQRTAQVSMCGKQRQLRLDCHAIDDHPAADRATDR